MGSMIFASEDSNRQGRMVSCLEESMTVGSGKIADERFVRPYRAVTRLAILIFILVSDQRSAQVSPHNETSPVAAERTNGSCSSLRLPSFRCHKLCSGDFTHL